MDIVCGSSIISEMNSWATQAPSVIFGNVTHHQSRLALGLQEEQ